MKHIDEKSEMAVVGAMIAQPKKVFDIIIDQQIQPEHFAVSKCRWIFEAAMAIGESCDPIQVSDHLNKAGDLDKIGEAYIEECFDSCFPAHTEYHCGILKDKYNRRKIIATAQETMAECETDAEPIDIASKLASVAVEISDVETKIDKRQITEDSVEMFLRAQKGEVSGVPLPWDDFSRRVGGIQKRCVCPLIIS